MFDKLPIDSDEFVAIIIVNYNSYLDTIECVKSIQTHITHPYKVYLVDNCSTNNSVHKIECFLNSLDKITSTTISFIKSKENNGFAAGNNIGIEFAKENDSPSFFWLLNNDTVLNEDALLPLVECYKSEKNIGILGSKLLFYSNPSVIQGLGGVFNPLTTKIELIGSMEADDGQYEDKNPIVDFSIGASLFISAKKIEIIGPMSEEYFLYFEELDWSLRAKLKGFKLLCCTKSRVYHKQGKSTGNKLTGTKVLEMQALQYRNLLIIYKKYFRIYYLSAVIITFLKCLKASKKHKFNLFKLLKLVFFS